MPFSDIDTWVFDLDDTLYPASSNFFPQVAERMGLYVAETFDLRLSSGGCFWNTAPRCPVWWLSTGSRSTPMPAS